MPTSPITVAFVGAGPMAREHLRAFQGLPGVSLGGIHSRTQQKAAALAQEFSLTHVADSIRSLYELSQAQLVVVAVPVLAARSVVEECCQFPWTILLEKPPGYNLAETVAIQATAAATATRVFVALNRRFLGSTQTALSDLADHVDEPRYIHVCDQQNLQAAAQHHHPAEVLRHWMFANSIHVIDLLSCFGRGPVTAVRPILPWTPKKPDVVVGHVQFASGDHGLYEGIWNGPGPWSVSITTPVRRWELRPLEKAARQTLQDRQFQQVPIDDRDLNFKPGFRRQAEEVVAALRGSPSQAATLAQARQTMELIQALFSL